MKNFGELRVFVALLAGTVGVPICLEQRHFTLEWSAGSVAGMLRHRCGMVLAAAVCWIGMEVVGQAVRSLVPAQKQIPTG